MTYLHTYGNTQPHPQKRHWNKHFNKLIVRDTRVHAAVLESLALLALRNTAIEVLVLSRVAAKTDFWIMFGMSLQGNSG